ncbi:exodeoxyribonuclease VII large subunit [Rhodothermus profundi]|uniref:Exodeoxyribonuclease 7 large subunit n=1 Tax=Rhodothermus profundi TaxID=633813 RepID=A0A1M6SQS7_9BACT|nr:exodeoxyribonuclease VII large subunit [Rhodothermus profundi]SHK46938.1 Exodeoxyribonuclease VII large subunit [Rhodothermus profundi]
MQQPLFASEPRVWRVRELTGALRDTIEALYDTLTVEGELSNFRRHRQSGHCYFTLQDGQAQLRCVMWSRWAQRLFFQPADGHQVQVRGRLTFYEPRGELQLIVETMTLAGAGARQQAFEALKRRLAAEGLFDPARKRPLPRFPRRIGMVTSDSGAALQDMLSILQRRFPLVEVLHCPVRVQGLLAAPSIAQAIRMLNCLPDDRRPDVLIVGRGGGSVEDLWAFNEEVVARAIFASRIPVISAVGHETDVTIADLVADRRAATPSMAAEIAVPDRTELEAELTRTAQRMHRYLQQALQRRRQHVHTLLHHYGLRRVPDRLAYLKADTLRLQERLHQHIRQLLDRRRHLLMLLQSRLSAFDPQLPLRRGYVRVRYQGHLATRSYQVQPGEVVLLEFYDGQHNAQILP